MMDEVLSSLSEIDSDYAEIRIQIRKVLTMRYYNGRVQDISSYDEGTVSLRALKNGSWYISEDYFSPAGDEERKRRIMRMIDDCERAVSNLPEGEEKIALIEPYKKSKEIKRRRRANLHERIGLFNEIASQTEDFLIWGAHIRYTETDEEKQIITSDGVCVSQKVPSCLFSFSVNTAVSSYTKLFGRTGDFEIEDIEDIKKEAKEMKKAALNEITAKKVKKGKYKVVFSPSITGALVEKISHLLEADFVNEGFSVIGKDSIGDKIAPDYVSICDHPGGYEDDFNFYAFDDEGVESRRKELIKNGVLNEFIHSRETAAKLGVEANGGGRGPIGMIPLPRASIIFMESDSTDISDIMDIKEGIYAKNADGGFISTRDGNVQINVCNSYLIEDGSPKKPLGRILIKGNALEMLKNIEEVGNDISIRNIEFEDKKGQVVSISSGGPHIRIGEVHVSPF